MHKNLFPVRWGFIGMFVVRVFSGFTGVYSVQAHNAVNHYTGPEAGSLQVLAYWSLGEYPSVSQDVVLDVNPGIKALTAGNLVVGSINVTAASGTFSVRNNTGTATDSHLTLGGIGNLGNSVSGVSTDLLYVASGSILNLRGDNGGTGAGVLRLSLGQSGDFNIAGVSEISTVISDGGSGYGIHKTGAGKLTLSAVNSYSGDTRVSAGTLILAASSSLTFVVTDASSNGLRGVGAVTLNGEFRIDTSGVSVGAGFGSWRLVDVAALNESFGADFRVSVGDWRESANVWTRADGERTWTFTEATGVLSLTSAGATAYDTWVSTGYVMNVVDSVFGADVDHDGLGNGLEWILGGDPTQNDTSAILPVVTGSASNGLTLVFHRESSSVGVADLVVEWGGSPGELFNELVIGSVDIPANGTDPSVSLNVPVAGKVTVHIPAVNAQGDKLFARLRATGP